MNFSLSFFFLYDILYFNLSLYLSSSICFAYSFIC